MWTEQQFGPKQQVHHGGQSAPLRLNFFGRWKKWTRRPGVPAPRLTERERMGELVEDRLWYARRPSQKMPSIAEPPTSSASTLAGHRATGVQTPTASPIVAAVPKGVVTTHCRNWGLAHSRCEARWLLYEPRRLLDRAWRDSLPRATSSDTEYRWSCLSDPLGSIRRTLLPPGLALRRTRDRRICTRAGVWPPATAARARLSVRHRPTPPGSPARRSVLQRGRRSSRRPACGARRRRCRSRSRPRR